LKEREIERKRARAELMPHPDREASLASLPPRPLKESKAKFVVGDCCCCRARVVLTVRAASRATVYYAFYVKGEEKAVHLQSGLLLPLSYGK
jgi:hypothetical protein